MKKFFLISIAVILLIIVCCPFVPPIYNRYTKPLWKNYTAGKEWYSKVNPESMEEVRDFCDRRGYSTEFYRVYVDLCG